MEYGQILLWWVAYQALALLGAPVAATLFPRFADRGAAFALPVALSILTATIYWVGRVSFGPATLLFSLGVLAALAALAIYRGSGEIHWRGYGEAALVFTVAFAFLVAVRAVDPSITPAGGEKFLDYGLLKSLLRADVLPPEDMWFAGESVQYYYGGHLTASVLAMLTGTAGRYAYNLALAGFYAMLVTAAYGLAGAITADRGYPRLLSASAAAFFVGFASNVFTPVRLLLVQLPDGLGSALAERLGYDPEVLSAGHEFSYWTASRVIPGTINEFPLFSFLNGDLHGHMMSTPFVLLVAALCYSYFRTPPANLARRRGVLAAALPVVGLLAVINTWDFPIGFGLILLTLLFAPGHPLGLLPASWRARVGVAPDTEEVGGTWATQELSRLLTATALAAVAALLAVLTVLPFFLGTASGRDIGFLPDRSGFGPLLLVHGAFLLLFTLYLLPRARELVRPERADRVFALGGLLVAIAWIQNLAVMVLVAPLLLVAWLLVRDRRDVGYEAVLLVAGAGLVVLVEFVFVDDHMGGSYERMNTVFKLYMQVWVLWAVAAGVALAGVVEPLIRDVRTSVADRADITWAVVGVVFAAALVVSLSTYGAMALGAHYEHGLDEPTLDATVYGESRHPGEMEAIRWIDANAEGQPNMVSKPGTSIYQWVNPESTFTGVPTLAGWVHEKGYRDGDLYDERVADVETIYTGSWDERQALLDRYDVEYVYVGPREWEEYGDGPEAFEDRQGIEPVFENEDVVIYRVERDALG